MREEGGSHHAGGGGGGGVTPCGRRAPVFSYLSHHEFHYFKVGHLLKLVEVESVVHIALLIYLMTDRQTDTRDTQHVFTW